MKTLLSALGFCLLLTFPVTAQTESNNPIRYAESSAELALYKVSDRTPEIQLLPVGKDGEVTQPPAERSGEGDFVKFRQKSLN